LREPAAPADGGLRTSPPHALTEEKRKLRAHLKPAHPPSKEADQPWHTNKGIEVRRHCGQAASRRGAGGWYDP